MSFPSLGGASRMRCPRSRAGVGQNAASAATSPRHPTSRSHFRIADFGTSFISLRHILGEKIFTASF